MYKTNSTERRRDRFGPGIIVGGVKKRRRRPSRKPKTEIVVANSTGFRETVQRLTGGTSCSQSSVTASPLASVLLLNSTRDLGDVLRLQHNAIGGHSGNPAAAEIPTVPLNLDASHFPQDPLPDSLFQGSEGSLNDIMGYTSQNSWMAMECVSESVSTTQFAGVYPSKIIRLPCDKMPCHLSGETDLSKEGGPYQKEAESTTEFKCLERDGNGDMIPRHFHSEDEADVNVDSWINCDNPMVQNEFIN